MGEEKFQIEIEDRPIDDRSKAICVERTGSIEQYLFEVHAGELLYQGPMNANEFTWTEVPNGAKKVAEDHFELELSGDTDHLKEIRRSMEA